MSRRAAVSLLLCTFTAGAHAGVIDMATQMGNANIFTLGNFTSWSSDVEGSVIAGGSINVMGYAINEKNADAFGSDGYAAVARNNITLQNGQINNGKVYAGGTVSLASANNPQLTGVKPIDFDAAAAYYTALSTDLATLAGSGSIVQKAWGETILTGSGSAVSVFNISGDAFKFSNNWQLSGLTAGQTMILNVGGTAAGANPNGVSFDAFKNYNVLYNFYEATTLDPRGMFGSVLAPKAAVNASWGVVNGSVVVGSWNSPTQINTGYYFSAINLSGFRDPLPVIAEDAAPATGEVPEPGSLGLAMAALGLLAWGRKRA